MRCSDRGRQRRRVDRLDWAQLGEGAIRNTLRTVPVRRNRAMTPRQQFVSLCIRPGSARSQAGDRPGSRAPDRPSRPRRSRTLPRSPGTPARDPRPGRRPRPPGSGPAALLRPAVPRRSGIGAHRIAGRSRSTEAHAGAMLGRLSPWRQTRLPTLDWLPHRIPGPSASSRPQNPGRGPRPAEKGVPGGC
jgi:hypothetical protein